MCFVFMISLKSSISLFHLLEVAQLSLQASGVIKEDATCEQPAFAVKGNVAPTGHVGFHDELSEVFVIESQNRLLCKLLLQDVFYFWVTLVGSVEEENEL